MMNEHTTQILENPLSCIAMNFNFSKILIFFSFFYLWNLFEIPILYPSLQDN